MSDKLKLVKGYNPQGLSVVLDGAHDLVKRASLLMFNITSSTPTAVSSSYRKEAGICLAEAEELIAAVRAEGNL